MPLAEIVIGRDDEDARAFGTKGTVYAGKHLVGTGDDTHLTSPILLDVLRPHVMLVTGKRGTGKSYFFGVIAEEFAKLEKPVRENLCVLIFDTQGIFWTMKFPNEKDAALLKEWDLKPLGFDVQVYIPFGQERQFAQAGVQFDAVFSFMPSELTAEDWLHLFSLNPIEPPALLLQRILPKMPERFGVDELVSRMQEERGFDQEKLVLGNLLESARSWGVFGDEGMPPILVPGKTSVLDLSLTPQNVRALLVSLVCRRVFAERTEARRKEELTEIEFQKTSRVPLPWLMIDEAHNFLPADAATVATEAISKIVKEGRQPGITLVMATQRPEKLDPDALSQCDVIVANRLTARQDIDALKSIMQTYMLFDISKYINALPRLKGAAIILDDNSERIYTARIRPRQSWHAGSSPVAL